MTVFAARASLVTGFVVAAVICGPAVAADKEARSRTARLQALTDCRKVVDGPERLTCYDSAAAALDVAEARGDIVVVDRAEVTKVSRQAFGFSLPSLSIFERGDDKGTPDVLDRIATVATRAYEQAGKWVVEVEDGGVWLQTDSEILMRTPRKGSKIEIRKAALGSFFMNVDGQRALRVKRIE